MSDLDLMEAQIEDLQNRVGDLESRLCPAPPAVEIVGDEARALLCIDAVCAIWGVTSAEIRARQKPKHIVLPRFAAMWLARTQTELSFPEIGRLFGRDHSTVQAACKRVPGLIESDPNFRERLEAADKWIGGEQAVDEESEASPPGGDDDSEALTMDDVFVEEQPHEEAIRKVCQWLARIGHDDLAMRLNRGEPFEERRTG